MNPFSKHAFLMFFLSAIPLIATDFHALQGDDEYPSRSYPVTDPHDASIDVDGKERLGFFEKRRRAKALKIAAEEETNAKRSAEYHAKYDPIKNLIEDLKDPEKRDASSDALLAHMNNSKIHTVARIDISACLQMEPPTKHSTVASDFGVEDRTNFWLRAFLLDETKFMNNKEFYHQSFWDGPSLREDLNSEQRVRFYNELHAELSKHW